MDLGTALGIVSLGMQCCKGLFSYYESFRDQDAAVTAMWNSAQLLEKTLASVERIIRDARDPELIAQLAENAILCQEYVHILEKKLDKVRGKVPSPASLRERIRSMGKRAVYPVKDSTLVKLREIMQDIIRDNLSIGLAGLQL